MGVSSGAIAAIAVRVAKELDEGNVVFVAPDDGWKYLSSGVYTKPIEELEAGPRHRFLLVGRHAPVLARPTLGLRSLARGR